MIKLSMITDEATQSLPEAIALAHHLGMTGVELRSVSGVQIDRIPEKTMREYKHLLDSEGLKVVNIASNLCKCPLNEENLVREDEKLKRLLSACYIFDVPYVRCFAFSRVEGEERSMDELARCLLPFAKQADKEGITLLLEADPSLHTTNHRLLAQLLTTMDHPGVAAIYDPGNCVWDREQETAFPDGYEQIKRFIRHMHVKDGIKTAHGAEAVKLGSGRVDYVGLCAALKRDGYPGYYSMEPHYRLAGQLSKAMLEYPGGDEFSQGGMAAMEETAQSFLQLMGE